MSEHSQPLPIFIGDYLVHTMALTGEENGAFLLLIMFYWQNGTLPNNDVKLARIARVSIRRWRRSVGPIIRELLVDDGDALAPKMVETWRRKAFGRLPMAEWSQLRAFIFQRDGLACNYCGTVRPDNHIDHVEPVARGGSNHPSNLVVACPRCNMSKGAKSLKEWLQ